MLEIDISICLLPTHLPIYLHVPQSSATYHLLSAWAHLVGSAGRTLLHTYDLPATHSYISAFYLSIIYLSIIYPSIDSFIYLSINSFIYLSIYLSACLAYLPTSEIPAYLCIYLSTHLSWPTSHPLPLLLPQIPPSFCHHLCHPTSMSGPMWPLCCPKP